MVLTLMMLLGASLMPVSPVKAAATIYVPDDYATIQAAVDNAVAGDTIIVRAGTYNESVAVNKDYLTIRGVNSDTVIVDGNGLGAVNGFSMIGFDVRNQGITIEGFTIKSFGNYGICVNKADEVTINNNQIINNISAGIYATEGTKITVTDNDVTNNGDKGIYINIDTLIVSGNTVIGNGKGGIRAFSDNDTINNIVSNNEVTGNFGYGIEFASNSIIVRDNTVCGNSRAGISFC
jgi:parallel beta-helix repeat protein